MISNAKVVADDIVDFKTRQFAADFFNVSCKTIDNWIGNGTIKAHKIGRRVLIDRKDLLDAVKLIPSRTEAEAL